MYPQQNLASNQPGFMGMPNSGHNFQGGYPQQPQQQQWPPISYAVPAFAHFYPQWFTQVTGQDVTQVETTLIVSIKNVLIQLSQQLQQAFMFNDLMIQNVEQHPEFNRLLGIARFIVIAIIAGGASKGVQQDASSAAYIAVYGAMVERIGGPQMQMFANIQMILNVKDLMAFHNQYIQAEPTYHRIVQQVNQRLAANMQQNVYGGTPVNNGYATARIAPSALLNSNATMGYGQQSPFPKPSTPFDGVGVIADASDDLYAIARQTTVNAAPIQTNNSLDIIPINQKPVETNTAGFDGQLNGGVMDPYLLHGMFGGASTNNAPEPDDVPITSERRVLPRGATEATVEVPDDGLPSLGHYEFGENKFDPDRYRIKATSDQHLQYAPDPTQGMSNESEQEEFMAQLQREAEAHEQSFHEANVQNVDPGTQFSSLDEALAQALDQGYEIKQPRLEVPYGDLSPKERQRLCREFRMRIVPAYLIGKSGLIQIAEGKVREVIIHRWEDVNYSEHETEVAQSKVFASWDRSALDASAAKNVLAAAASQDVWNEQFFLNKLSEKLEDNPQTEQDMLLSDLIADRQIIDIDDVIVAKSVEKDYVTEVIEELTGRGVSVAGTLLENSVVRYERFDSAMLHVHGVNLELIEKLREVRTASDIVAALNEFKINSTIPLREIARLIERATKQVNRYLATEFSNGWSIESITGDYAELSEALIEHYEHIYDEQAVLDILGAIYYNAVNYAFALRNANEGSDAEEVIQTVGTYSRIALVPFYYSQYPINYLDQAGAIVKEEHPELYDFLKVVNSGVQRYEIKLVTLDNVVLTFCQTLGEDGLFFMVEKN